MKPSLKYIHSACLTVFPRVSNRQLVGVVHAAEQVSHNDLLTMRTLMMNMKTLEVLKTPKLLLLDGKDDLVNDHEQDLDQQLLLELRDPVGAMAVHRQLVEVVSSCIVHLECWTFRKHINMQYEFRHMLSAVHPC